MEGCPAPPPAGTMNTDHGEVHVVRPALTVAHRCYKYQYTASHQPGWRARVQGRVRAWWRCSRGRVRGAVVARLPFLEWLPAYNLRANLLGDVIGGVTVGIMHIPQGMAYALLGGLPPITGLYMAFFPVLMYVFLGTSRHVSMGTFSVACLMMGKVVGELAMENPTPPTPSNTTTTMETLTDATTSLVATLTSTSLPLTTTPTTPPVQYTPQQVGAIVALAVGIWEVALAVAQLGEVFSMFLSDMLISGFTTAVAVHVVTSQVKYLFGIPVPRYNGPFKLIYTYRDVVSQLPSANPAVMVISATFMILLIVNNELLKPRAKKYTRLPIPIELFVVVTGTLLSYFADLNHNYHVRVVGDIPTGLPKPSTPPLELLPRVVMDAFTIGVISYTNTFSMAKIFAKRQGYTVDATQELYAQGVSNVFGSFFSCGPMAAAMSRSLIQEAVGGVTLLTSLISCLFILVVLLFIGPAFETLPNCVLSTIILVSLKGLFLQFYDLPALWAVSRLDALIWLTTFSVSVIIDIDYGLVAGVGVSMLVLLARIQRPPTARLGHVPHTDVYLDLAKYQLAVEVAGVRIFQFGGALHFANAEYFKAKLLSVSGLDLRSLTAARLHRLQQPDDAPQPTIRITTPEPQAADISACHVTSSKTQETMLDQETLSQATFNQETFNQETFNHDTFDQVAVNQETEALNQEKEAFTQAEEQPRSPSPATPPSLLSPPTLLSPLTPASPEEQNPDATRHRDSYLTLPDIHWVVVEMSGVTFVDTMGARTLTQIHKDLRDAGVTLCLVGVCEGVERTLSRCGTLDAITRDLVFHSTHDALTVITHSQLNLPSQAAAHV